MRAITQDIGNVGNVKPIAKPILHFNKTYFCVDAADIKGTYQDGCKPVSASVFVSIIFPVLSKFIQYDH